MLSEKYLARIAGLLYLIVIICGIFAEKYVRFTLVDLNDSAVTAQNIGNQEFLFRMGFVADLIMQLAYFLLPVVLYQLLKKTSKELAGLMVLSVTVAVAIMCINMLNHYAPLLLLNHNIYTSAFSTEQINNSVSFYLEMHNKGYHIAQLFFGLWLLPLGYLVFKSERFPKIIGILLIVGCFGYLTDFLIYFLCPENSIALSEYITAPADLGEFSLCLYLLIKGVKGADSSQ
ncbi:DUF4386 domain-containing protein [Arenibacter algicola]|uniref:DUF4386 domain-containing protein n=1 Tax=Arenibacter algicola TaxID=616991 RepID=A0A221UWD7_9FLAO|nr:DUF4386 domain-containing protein [Arenibacter algicola]ASO05642.1 hypothetical protein AREALGSMS7_02186 [Arenibacter algicola]|tara:strand:- start:665 stop:1357 length:693 start_codon:yes stop_codon:yes gene_type:complete